MNEFGISEKSFLLLTGAFARYPEVEEVLVFGSRAKGNYQQGSDIDLAIKGKECSHRTAMDIAGYLNEELPIPYYIDVLYYEGLKNRDLKEHIDRVGKPLITSAADSALPQSSSNH
ncbi:nucleotidyltransferase family protein [Persicitalea sp.]|uniref:nucleotidyltransferase family protein n=1 Tax=Persicitalea sp. TaxID=3100273 RepID=UPI003594168B